MITDPFGICRRAFVCAVCIGMTVGIVGSAHAVNMQPANGVRPGVAKKGGFAVITSTGQVARGENVHGTVTLGAGRYEVAFKASVAGCGYVATLMNPGMNPGKVAIPPSGESGTAVQTGINNAVYIETRDSTLGNDHAVYVETRDGAGVPTNRGFVVHIVCQQDE